MKQEHKQQLVFLGLCLNQNSSKCVTDGHRKRQVEGSKRNVEKLL
jgi:hypothetical protein